MNLFGNHCCSTCGGNLLPVTAQHTYAGSIKAVIYECEDCGHIWQQSVNPQPETQPAEIQHIEFLPGAAYRLANP
jgi:uncharacterized Zn finger protein